MKNLTKMLAVLALGVVLMPASAFAGAVTSTRASLQQSKDASGYPLQIESDRAWKVFEIKDTTSEVQVTDEDGKTPTTGVLHRVCLESAPGGSGAVADDWFIVWDSAAATGTNATSRRLLPPVMRATRAVGCSEVIDAIFTRGLRGLNGDVFGIGSSYIYWRELGAVR